MPHGNILKTEVHYPILKLKDEFEIVIFGEILLKIWNFMSHIMKHLTPMIIILVLLSLEVFLDSFYAP